MILNEVIQPQGSQWIVNYYNLRTKSAYTLVHDEFAEVSTEIPLIFNRDLVEPVIYKYLNDLTDDIDKLERLTIPTAGDKAEILRFKNQLNYLINYAY